ncbi:hypothetical protein SERLA73DRAFT_185708 [Serpula lacrymans var. lacrymans S7.3]|uniref:Uncharacterized protein n=1 Tax=Serpula lacrymans var. lacrymans (strain S7.3) TaxID=936435 RepID=F8Q697_SERL3|nr:hypothetical protein SERLA73DRAFT_185708 [Serpula lacrymans var. lacrymans S7.3]
MMESETVYKPLSINYADVNDVRTAQIRAVLLPTISEQDEDEDEVATLSMDQEPVRERHTCCLDHVAAVARRVTVFLLCQTRV